MCLKKPVSIEFVKYHLWQHVLKHRIKITTNGAKIINNAERTGKNGSMSEESFSSSSDDDDDQNGLNIKIKNKNKNRKGKKRYRDGSEMNSKDTKSSGYVKKKACTEWTCELHAKFMDAVTKLGEGSMSVLSSSYNLINYLCYVWFIRMLSKGHSFKDERSWANKDASCQSSSSKNYFYYISNLSSFVLKRNIY